MTQATAAAPVLRFRGVSRSYPGPPPVRALRRVDLRIERGDYVAIMGPSGSGKSTMLNLAALIDRPSSGSLQLDGIDIAHLPEARRTAIRAHRIGIVFQSFYLLPHRTALENVALAQLYRGIPRRQRNLAAVKALRLAGLTNRTHALPSTMSGGEQQRVAIARALVNQPSLLLFDEPTGDLDSHMAAEILTVLDNLNAAAYTIVLITHDPGVAARAGRLVTIRDGVLTDHQGRDQP
jgi:putative ABC transport system ATP-binding protein